MNPLILRFKECAHHAGETCKISNGKLIREHGLKDFLENCLSADDGEKEIVVKALIYFCEEVSQTNIRFRFVVLAVGLFLSEKNGSREIPVVALKDLMQIIRPGIDKQKIHQWIDSHFPS